MAEAAPGGAAMPSGRSWRAAARKSGRARRATSAIGVARVAGPIRAGSVSSWSAAAAGRRGAQSRPADLPGETELIQPARVVVTHTRHQQITLPGTGWRLEALQPLERAPQPRPAAEHGCGRDALPARKKAHVVRPGDGRDALPQPLEGVPMDASKQPAVAELVFARVRREPAPEQVAGRFRLLEPPARVALLEPRAARELAGRRGPEAVGMAAHEREARRFAIVWCD